MSPVGDPAALTTVKNSDSETGSLFRSYSAPTHHDFRIIPWPVSGLSRRSRRLRTSVSRRSSAMTARLARLRLRCAHPGQSTSAVEPLPDPLLGLPHGPSRA